ncbi:MAG TPA: thioesterase family protein [Candidatus Limnocylindria bacterium]|nr:thioesterase family protein [Candidatus Limnocylindria bacterium]
MSDDFRHRTRLQVRFRDIDAFGHVNNSVVSTYVEQARVTFLRDVLGLQPVGPEDRMPLILAMIRVDYRSPIVLEDRVEVGSRVDWVGRTSIGMSHHLHAADGRELATSTSVLVTYDYQRARPMPVPDHWRASLAAHEGRSLEREPQAVR